MTQSPRCSAPNASLHSFQAHTSHIGCSPVNDYERQEYQSKAIPTRHRIPLMGLFDLKTPHGFPKTFLEMHCNLFLPSSFFSFPPSLLNRGHTCSMTDSSPNLIIFSHSFPLVKLLHVFFILAFAS